MSIHRSKSLWLQERQKFLRQDKKHPTKDKINMVDFTKPRNLQGHHHATERKDVQLRCLEHIKGFIRQEPAADLSGISSQGTHSTWRGALQEQSPGRGKAEHHGTCARMLTASTTKAKTQTIQMSTHGWMDRMHPACASVCDPPWWEWNLLTKSTRP